MNAGQISEMIGRFSGSMTECTVSQSLLHTTPTQDSQSRLQLEVVLEIGVAVANIQDRLKVCLCALNEIFWLNTIPRMER